MSTKTPNNGGPAFPHPAYQDVNGMSLRDYFAASAIQGLVRSRDHEPPNVLALEAYYLADAMLAEREKAK